jgi:chemotaxis protein methyltransferase CheR
MLTSRQFERTQRLALRLAGIELVERHRELLLRRSRRLGIQDDVAFEELLRAAEAGEPSATRHFLGLLTTKFTSFFRHPAHFEAAAEQALQAVKQRGRARIWSAGAATGEEAWSLAMAVTELFQSGEPPICILATDVDAGALAVAERGEYSEAMLKPVSADRRARFFVPPTCVRVGPAVRKLLEFQPLNLVAEEWPMTGWFDVIFCRNVLMYLEAHHRRAVLERMAALLFPDGLLMLDPSEHPAGAAALFNPASDGIYSLRRNRSATLRPEGVGCTTG